ncbi:MAG: hypothetical protein ACOC7T_02795 [Planctomycetota bacterium]
MRNGSAVRGTVLIVLIAVMAALSTGCGHLKNIRDDVLDVGTVAVGVVPPVVPGEEGDRAVGFFPPAFGAYAQATDLLHLGAIYKATGDAEWDRRGYGLTVDVRRKFGIGPIHDVYIEQKPYFVNAYKRPDSPMAGWRGRMEDLSDPIFDQPAKVLIFEPEHWQAWGYAADNGWRSLPWLSHGWQSWETLSLEVAIPEPFILHSGFYARVGFDPSETFDLLLSIFGIDLYGDAAYNFDGSLKY